MEFISHNGRLWAYIATAIFAGGDSLQQVWAFILAPLVGGVLGGLTYLQLTGGAHSGVDIEGKKA